MVLNCRIVQKEKGKEKCGSPSPVKILYRLDPYENVSSKYHLTGVFFSPGFILGQTRNQLPFQTASFKVVEGPRRHKPADYFQHSDLHLPEILPTRTEDGWPTFTLTLLHCWAGQGLCVYHLDAANF